jgi:DNA mismatch endonuclease, patch repair protein
MGYRFRVCRKDLPGCPDIVFPRLRKVIFVHGCFWHGHDCGGGTRIPAQNRPYWKAKITKNIYRDAAATEELERLGWRTKVFWECELRDQAAVTADLAKFLNETCVDRIGR